MAISTVLLIALLVVMIGALPTWPHSRSWGYGPSSIASIVFLALLLALIIGGL